MTNKCPSEAETTFYVDQFASTQDSNKLKMKTTFVKSCSLSSKMCRNLLFFFLPIIQWLPKYNLRKLMKDFIPGLTIGVMQIPQGLAEANLAGVHPIYGLYSSFFPSLLYFFVGASFLTSFGSVSLISLMVGNARFRFSTNDTAPDDPNALTSIEVTTSLCLLVGLIQLVGAVLHLGFFASYMSEPLMRAYATGCAFYVIIAQVPSSFGLTLQRRQGPLQLFYTTYDLFSHITETKIPTLITTVLCTLIILITKSFIDPAIHKKFKMHIPVPIDLLVVVVGTGISYAVDFSALWNMQIVGVIPSGFPVPVVPRVDLWSQLWPDAVAIAIVSYCLSLSMAQILGKRNHYKVSPNQECYSVGFIQTVTSFFECYSSSASLSRSLVLDSIGCKTQIAGLIGNSLVLIVILWLTPLLQSLPNCILAAIILANLKRLLLQFSDLKIFWKYSKVDFFIWLVTFVAVCIMNVTWGLFIGVAFAVLTVLLRSQWPYIATIDIEYGAKNIVPIFRFHSALYFANAEIFKKKIWKQNGSFLNCNESFEIPEEKRGSLSSSGFSSDTSIKSNMDNQKNSISQKKLQQYLIIDGSGIVYVDVMGISILEQVFIDFENSSCTILFVSFNASVLNTFSDSCIYKTIPKWCFFESIDKAVQFVQVNRINENMQCADADSGFAVSKF